MKTTLPLTSHLPMIQSISLILLQYILDWPVLTACPSSPPPSLELTVIRPLYQKLILSSHHDLQITKNPTDTLWSSSTGSTRQHLTHLMVPSLFEEPLHLALVSHSILLLLCF